MNLFVILGLLLYFKEVWFIEALEYTEHHCGQEEYHCEFCPIINEIFRYVFKFFKCLLLKFLFLDVREIISGQIHNIN